MADMSPSDAVTDEAVEEAVEDAADEASSGVNPLEMLLHTDPPLQPSEVEDTVGESKPLQHGYIGLRKVIDHVAGARGMEIGGGSMPAIGNFGLAVLLGLREASESEEEDDDGWSDRRQ